jgi:putative membrane protein
MERYLMREGLNMKTCTIVRCLGLITCLTFTPQLSFAQDPPTPTKLPPQPSGNPPADPRMPTEANPVPKGNDQGTGDQKALKNAPQADSRFVMTAAEGGIMEVELGRLASQKASNAEVKEFGEKMVTDHSKANEELKSIAGAKNITLPTEEKVKQKHQGAIAKLEKLEGAAFDKAYMAHMVKDHDKDVALFQKQATSGRDTEFKAFAEKTLPTLKEHQKMAKEINAKVSAKGTN